MIHITLRSRCNVSAGRLEVKREGQRWFDTLPEDYLPGARRDSVTTQHSISMTDRTRSVTIAHRQAFHWIYPGYVNTKNAGAGCGQGAPGNVYRKVSVAGGDAVLEGPAAWDAGGSHDLGPINIPTVEPDIAGRYIFDYALAGSGALTMFRSGSWGQNSIISAPNTVRPVRTGRSKPKLLRWTDRMLR